jgi:hypothetical protein
MGDTQVPRERTKLKDDPALISPPIVVDDLYSCAKAVQVIGFIPLAKIDVRVDGTIVASVQVGYPDPDGATIPLPSALITGQKVTARQKTSTATSGWSATVVVRDYKTSFPAGPPRPEINPAPVFNCGSRTGVGNLLVGGNVWINANSIEVGRVNGCSDHQGVNVTPDYGLNQTVVAQFEMCSDKSAPSLSYTTGNATYPLATPGFDPAYQGSTQVRITNIANGARVTLSVNGVSKGTSRCWGYALYWGLSSPLNAGDTLSATQALCSGQPHSPAGSSTVQPCSALPSPGVYPIQIGDQVVYLTSWVPGAIIKVYVNNVKVGESSGSPIALTKQIVYGDTVLAGQELGSCKSKFLTGVQPACVAPPQGFDPSAVDFFPIGNFEYAQGDTKGSVYYPAETDGLQTKFNTRLAALGPVPIVFMAHGNHSPTDPSYLGYVYFQQQLAAMGLIAVSIDANALNGVTGTVLNIEQRADLIIETIQLFQTFNSTAGNTFNNHIDFTRVGLMGHSRGGDAVTMVPARINLAGVKIGGVIALAPTDYGWRINNMDTTPTGFDYMTILPAGDGDVWDNEGARFFDKALPPHLKCQVYIHYTNHNFFNRQWLNNDSADPTVILSRNDHERYLSVYGCAFFRYFLLHDAPNEAFLTGYAIPTGAQTKFVYLSFKKTGAKTIDDHEDHNGIGINSVGGATTQTGLTADEYLFRESTEAGAPALFDDSFFGNSIGMVAVFNRTNGVFTSAIKKPVSIVKKEIWIRVAEVYQGKPHTDTGFQLGVRDSAGATAWVDSNGVGSVMTPYVNNTPAKSMLRTLRFPASCFVAANAKLRAGSIQMILIRQNRPMPHPPLAFDDLQIVGK